MKAAICGGGASLREHLPFPAERYDVIVAVNDAATLIPWTHWAALDHPHLPFRRKFLEWRRVDWGQEILHRHAMPEFPCDGRRMTMPLALNALLKIYDPDEIDAYGIDMAGARLDGDVASLDRWKHEEELMRRLDLSRVGNWFGRWRP